MHDALRHGPFAITPSTHKRRSSLICPANKYQVRLLYNSQYSFGTYILRRRFLKPRVAHYEERSSCRAEELVAVFVPVCTASSRLVPGRVHRFSNGQWRVKSRRRAFPSRSAIVSPMPSLHRLDETSRFTTLFVGEEDFQTIMTGVVCIVDLSANRDLYLLGFRTGQ